MADSADTPNWDLLPHDPIRFFELADGFDRKDLKRAYNRLLRVFKPEKFPAEFQRIRAAFEQLDEHLRYHGGAAPSSPPVQQVWQTDDRTAEDAAQSQPRKLSLADRLHTESPGALYQELKQRQGRTPYDYYALAVLSDVVVDSSKEFAAWLVEGIAAHQSDGALKQLLHDYFREAPAAEMLLELLPRVAKAVRSDEFYPLTEPAWQTVMRECKFHEFTTAYDNCEAELRDSHIVGRMAFLIHMLKSALWRDEQLDGWAARQLRFIEENFSSIPPWLEWDVELLGLAREYLLVRQQFAAGSPLRGHMDAALKDYFSQPQQVGDRSMVAAQMELLSSGDALMHEFPIEQGELLHKFYPIWSLASHDVAERQSFKTETEVDQRIWADRGLALLARAEKQSARSLTGIKWSACKVARVALLWAIILVGLALVFSGFALFLDHRDSGARPRQLGQGETAVMAAATVVAMGLASAHVVLSLVKIRPWLDRKLWAPLDGKLALECYNRIWRREVLDFQRRSHVTDRFFRAVFLHFSTRTVTAYWINEFVQQDFAPALLAEAQRYEA